MNLAVAKWFSIISQLSSFFSHMSVPSKVTAWRSIKVTRGISSGTDTLLGETLADSEERGGKFHIMFCWQLIDQLVVCVSCSNCRSVHAMPLCGYKPGGAGISLAAAAAADRVLPVPREQLWQQIRNHSRSSPSTHPPPTPAHLCPHAGLYWRASAAFHRGWLFECNGAAERSMSFLTLWSARRKVMSSESCFLKITFLLKFWNR